MNNENNPETQQGKPVITPTSSFDNPETENVIATNSQPTNLESVPVSPATELAPQTEPTIVETNAITSNEVAGETSASLDNSIVEMTSESSAESNIPVVPNPEIINNVSTDSTIDNVNITSVPSESNGEVTIQTEPIINSVSETTALEPTVTSSPEPIEAVQAINAVGQANLEETDMEQANPIIENNSSLESSNPVSGAPTINSDPEITTTENIVPTDMSNNQTSDTYQAISNEIPSMEPVMEQQNIQTPYQATVDQLSVINNDVITPTTPISSIDANNMISNDLNNLSNSIIPENTESVKKSKSKIPIIIIIILAVVAGVVAYLYFTDNEIITNLIGSKTEEQSNIQDETENENVPTEESSSKEIRCKTDKEATTYEKGQYVYDLVDGDHWHVQLKDIDSTDPITSEVCTYINDIPITDMSYMYGMSQASSVDLNGLNTTNVTNMSYMFYNSAFKELDLSPLNTSNVTTMQGMFSASKLSKIDISSFDTSKVENMGTMFAHVNANLILGNLDLSSLTIAAAMFWETTTNKIDFSKVSTPKLNNTSTMFWMANIDNVDLSGINTSNVTDMNTMFSEAKIRNLNISGFNTSKVQKMHHMFEKAQISDLDISSFQIDESTEIYCMFDYFIGRVKVKDSNTKQILENYGYTDFNGEFII